MKLMEPFQNVIFKKLESLRVVKETNYTEIQLSKHFYKIQIDDIVIHGIFIHILNNQIQ